MLRCRADRERSSEETKRAEGESALLEFSATRTAPNLHHPTYHQG